jgi:hypothetical protein
VFTGECPSDTGILRLYKELGCKPVKSDAEKCATAFSCRKFSNIRCDAEFSNIRSDSEFSNRH